MHMMTADDKIRLVSDIRELFEDGRSRDQAWAVIRVKHPTLGATDLSKALDAAYPVLAQMEARRKEEAATRMQDMVKDAQGRKLYDLLTGAGWTPPHA